MAYTQLTNEERYTLAALRHELMSIPKIAERLGRHRSTIWREVRRNRSQYDGWYRAFRAIEKTSGRRSRSRRNQQFTCAEYKQVERKLAEGWSPEQIAGRFTLDGSMSISHETIYKYVWRDMKEGGQLYRHLRQAGKQRRKRYGAYDSRGRLAGKRHISERPQSAALREAVGHWEVDTVVGGKAKDCVTTLVERKTGYAYIGKLRDRSKLEMSRRTKKLIRRSPQRFETITSDNGSEFHDYEAVERATGVTYYFATPSTRGSEARMRTSNGLLRQYLPKQASQAHVTQATCDALAKLLNRRPRKRLGYRTPEECFHEY